MNDTVEVLRRKIQAEEASRTYPTNKQRKIDVLLQVAQHTDDPVALQYICDHYGLTENGLLMRCVIALTHYQLTQTIQNATDPVWVEDYLIKQFHEVTLATLISCLQNAKSQLHIPLTVRNNRTDPLAMYAHRVFRYVVDPKHEKRPVPPHIQFVNKSPCAPGVLTLKGLQRLSGFHEDPPTVAKRVFTICRHIQDAELLQRLLQRGWTWEDLGAPLTDGQVQAGMWQVEEYQRQLVAYATLNM